ncbi:aldo/keto reductase [Algicella marina]|uniref:Aldo/keto reductase n=1 Tax=Algicella marina TaxID=2683284 RepID=A0A6P1T3N0_9RHOB|nr:aldo/keto reductase [Algicella marina]QHQ35122.1 aldo/keto reductase [Algicella marina]
MNEVATVALSLRSGLKLSPLGFGTAPLGNLYAPLSEDSAAATVRAALDAGITYVDTAPFYGLGLAEDRLGRILPDDVTVSTKVGRLLEDCSPEEATPEMFVDVPSRKVVFDYSYDGVMRSFESSVSRLGRTPEILLIHDIDPGTHGQEVSDAHMNSLLRGGGYRALEELRTSGSIRAIGAGVNAWEICERLLGEGDFDCFLLAGRYTLLEQEAQATFLPLCAARDVGIIIGGPYNSGILATGPVSGARYDYEPAPPEILARVADIERVCKAHDVTLIAAALHFVLAHPVVRAVIPGAAAPEEVAANARLYATKVPPALWHDLRAEGLIRADVPLPGDDHAA